MNKLTLFFMLPLLLLSVHSLAKGHGGHGGGHGGHAGGHGAGHGSASGAAGHSAASRTKGASRSSRSAMRSSSGVAARFHRGVGAGLVVHGYPHEHPGTYPYYYYGYSPFLYDPYLSMWSFGMNFMYTPHYTYDGPDNYNNGSNGGDVIEDYDGFVVFANDTIRGSITLKNNTVMLVTRDSARGYDYKFKNNNKELKYVTVYNADSNQINLVRVKEDDKKLWRIVHLGTLNVYDEGRGFIYRPEDIDPRNIMVVYNGEATHLHAANMEVTKQRLTAFVNKAYNTTLDPRKFSWKELLIYIDKLD